MSSLVHLLQMMSRCQSIAAHYLRTHWIEDFLNVVILKMMIVALRIRSSIIHRARSCDLRGMLRERLMR